MDPIFENDTCEACGAARTEHGQDIDNTTWLCTRCHSCNNNGSGKNAVDTVMTMEYAVREGAPA